MTKVARQPNWCPIMVPSGTPITVATVMPEVTNATARPRRSGEATATATPMAVGMHRPAPSAISTRDAISNAKLGAATASRLPAMKQDSASVSTVLRSKLLKVTARIGDPSA
jgi:hypothetical protein